MVRTMCIRDTKCVYLAPTTCDTIVIVTLWFETRTFYFIFCLSVRFTLATYVLVLESIVFRMVLVGVMVVHVCI